MSNEHSNEFNEYNSHDDNEYGGAGQPPAPTATMPPPPGPAQAIPAANTGSSAARTVFLTLGVAVLAVVGTTLFAIALLVAAGVGAVIGIAAEVDVEEISHNPTTVEAIPTSIVSDQADVVIDLTALSAEDFESRTEPLAMDVDVEVGSVRVIVPEGVSVAVDAQTDVGSTQVFDRTNEGFDNQVIVDGGAATEIDLTIDVEVGNVDVERN